MSLHSIWFVNPHNILVVTRERTLGERLSAVFADHGAPYVIEASTTLAYEQFVNGTFTATIVDLVSLGQEGEDLIADIRHTNADATIVAMKDREEDMNRVVRVVTGESHATTEIAVPVRPATILVVDDEELVREMLSRALTRHGYRVIMASDGERAMQMLDAEPIDLVFLDISMPRLGGLAVLQWISERDHPPRVVMVSAHGDRSTKLETLRLGAFDYLEKPVSLERLLATASTAMALDAARTRTVWKGWMEKGS